MHVSKYSSQLIIITLLQQYIAITVGLGTSIPNSHIIIIINYRTSSN